MRKVGGERALKLFGRPEDFIESRFGLMKDERSGVVESE